MEYSYCCVFSLCPIKRSDPSASSVKWFDDVDFDVKHPIIFGARHMFVKFFLQQTHIKNNHQGLDYLRAKVLNLYVVLKLRIFLRSSKSNCVTCRMFRAATFQPSWLTSSYRDLRTNILPLPTRGLIAWAFFTSPFVERLRRGGESSSRV